MTASFINCFKISDMDQLILALIFRFGRVILVQNNWRWSQSDIKTLIKHYFLLFFRACHSGKLKVAFTSPDFTSTSPKSFLISRLLISKFFCYSNSSKNSTCPSSKLKTDFTSPVAKSTSPRLSDTTFFARWWVFEY